MHALITHVIAEVVFSVGGHHRVTLCMFERRTLPLPILTLLFYAC
jgi:hypothetical protein